MRPISEVRQARVDVPVATARAFLQNLENIERTEVKADAVTVLPSSPTKGTYRVHGRFAGVPWRSEFDYELHDAGFHSYKRPDVRPTSFGISGGFIVTPLGEARSLVTHYEDYELPAALLPLRPLIRAYLRWSMKVELRDVAAELTRPPYPQGV